MSGLIYAVPIIILLLSVWFIYGRVDDDDRDHSAMSKMPRTREEIRSEINAHVLANLDSQIATARKNKKKVSHLLATREKFHARASMRD